jgi:hypothetical protein
MMKKQESGISLKRTLSMRNQMDIREKEMMEKCDLADALERVQIKDEKVIHDKKSGFGKLMPY